MLQATQTGCSFPPGLLPILSNLLRSTFLPPQYNSRCSEPDGRESAAAERDFFPLKPRKAYQSTSYSFATFPVFPRPQELDLSSLYSVVITSIPTWELWNSLQIFNFFSHLLSLQNRPQPGDPLAGSSMPLPSRSLLNVVSLQKTLWVEAGSTGPPQCNSSFHVNLFLKILNVSMGKSGVDYKVLSNISEYFCRRRLYKKWNFSRSY